MLKKQKQLYVKQLSAKEFKKRVCKAICKICRKPKKNGFCYFKYNFSPRAFIQEVLPSLKALQRWPIYEVPYNHEREIFEKIFCRESVCGVYGGDSCESTICLSRFCQDGSLLKRANKSMSIISSVFYGEDPEPLFFSDDDTYWLAVLNGT